MKSTIDLSHRFRSLHLLCAAAAAYALVTSAGAAAQGKPVPAPAAAQKTFATAQEAADALVSAAESFDRPALKAILGPDADYLVAPGEPAKDRETAMAFAAKAREKSAVVADPKNPNRATLIVGDQDWPLPIPIVRKGGRWRFDSAAGRQEILYRAIGRNELDAIDICRGYVEAQHEYALVKHEGSSVNQYAQRIISSPGKQDGLAWQNPDGTWGGPIGENVARAIEQGYSDKALPYHGYFFKVLKGQGPAAPLGEMDFVVKGVMIGGFALVAAPAEYGVTGVKTFMVSHDGVVYEKDLGAKTLSVCRAMERFNPDKTWTPVIDE
jgi:Protein of unknown function (DUF2950)